MNSGAIMMAMRADRLPHLVLLHVIQAVYIPGMVMYAFLNVIMEMAPGWYQNPLGVDIISGHRTAFKQMAIMDTEVIIFRDLSIIRLLVEAQSPRLR